MRRQGGRVVVVALGVAASAWVGVVFAQRALAGLGVSEATGRQIVEGWLDSGYIDASPAARAFKAAAIGSRAALLKDAVAWAKSYTESPAFKAEYEKRRQAGRPVPPDAKGSVEDELARQRAERSKGVADLRKSLADLPPDLRKSMEAAIKEAEAANRKMDTDPEMVAMARQMVEAERAGEQEAHKERMAAYEQRWPADPNALIARRLREFLEVSRDIDFDAKLVPAGSKLRFADPRYEEKPPMWKLCYRAGRDAVAAAREAAQAWLKTLA